jgi:hypothetical protein
VIAEFQDQFAKFQDQLQAAGDALDEAQRDAAERMNIAIPEPYELPTPELATAPDPLYSSRDDWRTATERLIAYRDLGGDLGEEPTE